MSWNFDVSAMPKGGMVTKTSTIKGKRVAREEYEAPKLIAATSCGKVTLTYWVPHAERWCMFNKDNGPIAWQPWPEHPGQAPLHEAME